MPPGPRRAPGARPSIVPSPAPPPRRPQSILTGESHSVDKDAAAVHVPKAVYQDKTNMLYSVST